MLRLAALVLTLGALAAPSVTAGDPDEWTNKSWDVELVCGVESCGVAWEFAPPPAQINASNSGGPPDSTTNCSVVDGRIVCTSSGGARAQTTP